MIDGAVSLVLKVIVVADFDLSSSNSWVRSFLLLPRERFTRIRIRVVAWRELLGWVMGLAVIRSDDTT